VRRTPNPAVNRTAFGAASPASAAGYLARQASYPSMHALFAIGVGIGFAAGALLGYVQALYVAYPGGQPDRTRRGLARLSRAGYLTR
jgi:hypothetical protein